jgi:hypothetical protein
MAVLSTTALTLADHAKRIDPDGKIARIVEILNDQNEILSDMRWVEGNLPTGHRTTVRTGLPSATWRMLNYGVATGKSTTAQVTDSCGMLETYSEVDKALVDLSGDPAAFRMSEAVAFIEGMNQQMATTLFYGNQQVNPERFTGLAPRYNTLSTNEDLIGFNIIDAGGSGSDNTSIWLVVWGDNSVHGIIPKGSTAGLQHRDLGEQTLFDANNGRYQGFRDHYKWDAGLTVRDWRYVVRIANIDVSDLTASGTVVASTKALIDTMIAAEEKIPNFGMGTPVWYANRTVRTALRRGMLEKIANNLTNETVAGKQVTMFNGTTLRRTDAILNTESRVV